ncbi:TetR family transcriptional regulator [Amycolatopsis cynarae]|uniref:TetR family transcriptional regulator n=1 Tax=Amycolatopsis cynarae TaxID=2995223 RepID=A0ABY7AXD1_9PSEU|nr:TetR/AcrR family transcriptional regulator [Amycolatopsis sp. HUAS 11-8]WAL64143.1 TetR family transcriptional regulator [Amycolatopsis sp. HUAS 11-8]
MTPDTPPRSRRAHNAAASREAILAAARTTFAEKGYDRATIREIARRADTANGLVLRHFGTKRALFLASLSQGADPADITDTAGTGTRDLDGLAGHLLTALRGGQASAPFLALLRTAPSNPEVAIELRRTIRDLIARADGRDPDDPEIALRIDLLGAVLIGVTFVRDILGSSALADLTDAQVSTLLQPMLRAALAASAA